MNRRQFNQRVGGVLGSTLLGVSQRGTVRGGPRIVVVGAGIVGASIAYHLAERGAAVTILERAHPGAGATGKSFAWINATFSKQPYAYYALNLQGISEWRRLERELRGAIRVDWGGSVEWYPPGSEASVHQREVARHRQWGYPTRLVDAATLQRLLPGVRPGSIGAASFSSEEGTVDPVEVVQALLAQAQAYGARLLDACAVTGWLFAGEGGTGRIRRVRGVQTTQGEIDGEVVVLAAGTGIPTMAGLAGVQVPLVESPGLLLHLRPEGRLVDRVVLAPGVHLLQRRDGRLITGSGFGGTPSNDQSPAQIERMRAAAVPLLPSLRDAQFERLTLGWRVMPQDELPILGFPHSLPNVYLAAMHSGITLAPLIGRLVATEILDRIPIDLLAPFRIERFSRVAGH